MKMEMWQSVFNDYAKTANKVPIGVTISRASYERRHKHFRYVFEGQGT